MSVESVAKTATERTVKETAEEAEATAKQPQ